MQSQAEPASAAPGPSHDLAEGAALGTEEPLKSEEPISSSDNGSEDVDSDDEGGGPPAGVSAAQLLFARNNRLDAAPSPPPLPKALTPEEIQTLEKARDVRKLHQARNIPACPEPKPNKVHWDWVLEEMKWMANEFNQERKWRLAQAKRFAAAASKSNMDVESRNRKKDLEEAQAVRKKASWIAKQVR